MSAQDCNSRVHEGFEKFLVTAPADILLLAKIANEYAAGTISAIAQSKLPQNEH